MIKQRYNILTSKTYNQTTFCIIYDPDGIGSWRYKIQYETDYRNKYKKMWSFQKFQEAIDEFDCESMLRRIDWLRR